jgi:ribosome-associated protein
MSSPAGPPPAPKDAGRRFDGGRLGDGRSKSGLPATQASVRRIIFRLSPARTTPLQLARLLRGAAVDKKAWDTVVIDVRKQTSVADYFVICEGETDRQVRAIADAMVEAAKVKQLRPLAVDGYGDASWILLDFDSVLAHVFLPGERSYYDLDSLWGRALKRRRKAV